MAKIQYKDKVKIVWKNFPSPGNELSFKAAIAVLAASEQNEFAAYQHMLLSESAKLDEVRLRTLAVELGLNMEKFDLDMKSPILLCIINRDIGEAIQAGVLTTPAIFINGKTVEDISFTGLQELIEAEIEEKKQPRVEQGNTTN